MNSKQLPALPLIPITNVHRFLSKDIFIEEEPIMSLNVPFGKGQGEREIASLFCAWESQMRYRWPQADEFSTPDSLRPGESLLMGRHYAAIAFGHRSACFVRVALLQAQWHGGSVGLTLHEVYERPEYSGVFWPWFKWISIALFLLGFLGTIVLVGRGDLGRSPQDHANPLLNGAIAVLGFWAYVLVASFMLMLLWVPLLGAWEKSHVRRLDKMGDLKAIAVQAFDEAFVEWKASQVVNERGKLLDNLEVESENGGFSL